MPGNTSRENGKKGGRPKGYAAIEAEKKRDATAKLLDKEWTPIVKRTIKDAKNGDSEARKFLRDFTYGKPKESSDIHVSGFSLLDLGLGADKHEDD